MNSNRSYKNPPPNPPAPAADFGDLDDNWGEEPEAFDRPTIIPEVLPTEAELIAKRPLPPARPPTIDPEWEHPSAVIEKNTAATTGSELEFDLDDLGSPASPFAPPKGPGKARPISFQGLPPQSAPVAPTYNPSTKTTPPARPPSSKVTKTKPVADVAPLPPAPPPRAPSATLIADDPLAFDLQLHDDLAAPARESFSDDFDVDFEAIRNPKMREPPPSPAVPDPETEEHHTAPYSFDHDPVQKHHTPGHFRQPPPVAAPTHPLEDLIGGLLDEPPVTAPRPPMMGEPIDPQARLSPAERHLREMRDKFALGDFSGSLKAAESLLELGASQDEAQRFSDSCKSRLRGMYEAKLGALSKVPRVVLPPEQVRWLSLDHRSGFVLSCVDGYSSVEEILDVSGMPQLDTLRILYELLQQKVIGISLARMLGDLTPPTPSPSQERGSRSRENLTPQPPLPRRRGGAGRRERGDLTSRRLLPRRRGGAGAGAGTGAGGAHAREREGERR